MSQIPLGASESAPGSASNSGLLTLNHLSVIFKRLHGIFRTSSSVVRAVNDVSFEVKESEILSLVGESGSGKTTIARCVLGLMPATSGSITFRGKDLSQMQTTKSTDFRREVQMIFQDPFESLNPREDVYTAISIPLRRLSGMRNDDEVLAKVRSLLQEVGLEADRAIYKLPYQLSGGERQRVNIARALASDPKLLVADEPITMLDASQRLNILSLLYRLKERRNLTILMITHDLASAKALSNTTAVMYRGNLVEIGPTDVILSKPAHPYTESILAATPKLRGGVVSAGEGEIAPEDLALGSMGCIFRSRCKYATEICAKEDPKLLPKSSVMHLAACHNPLV